jgi:hypothetical protein
VHAASRDDDLAGLAEIVPAVIDAGMQVTTLREHAECEWGALKYLVDGDDGKFRLAEMPGAPADECSRSKPGSSRQRAGSLVLPGFGTPQRGRLPSSSVDTP